MYLGKRTINSINEGDNMRFYAINEGKGAGSNMGVAVCLDCLSAPSQFRAQLRRLYIAAVEFIKRLK